MNHSLHRHAFAAMGCPCEVALYASTPGRAQTGFGLVEKEVRRLDRKYSHYRPDSHLARLARRAMRGDGAAVDAETAGLLDYAARQYEASGGRFDITARRLTRLWDRAEAVPGGRAVARALRSTGWHRVGWDGQTLRLPRGYALDLGGVVKEYAADRAALRLRQAGFDAAYVDLGGDFHVVGPHPDGRPWRIGIRQPGHRDRPAAAVDVREGGLASSGDYERFTQIDGVRYSHFVDPGTGHALPVAGSGSAVSVLAPSCLLAGSVATLAMLYGARAGRQFLADSGLHWLAVDASGVRCG